MKTKIYILALLLILIVILSALCASYKGDFEGMMTSDPELALSMLPKVPLLPNSTLANLLGNFFNIVKRNEQYLVFVYNQMYRQDKIDCSLNSGSCSSIIPNDVLPFNNEKILQTCCPETVLNNSSEVSPVLGSSENIIQENLELLLAYIFKHEQLLIIFKAQGKTSYIPSTDLINIITGDHDGIESLRDKLEFIADLEPVPTNEYVQCDTTILRQEIEELQNSLSQFDDDGQRDIRRKIQDRKIRIIFLESNTLKNNIKCDTNPTYNEPAITENGIQSRIQMLTLYYLYHILSNQNSGIQILEQNLTQELKALLPFEISETAELQQSLFNM